MNKETIIIVAAIVWLILGFYTINKISKLNLSKSKKAFLYYLTVIIPLVGFLLMQKASKEV
jgi:hypothetical protein